MVDMTYLSTCKERDRKITVGRFCAWQKLRSLIYSSAPKDLLSMPKLGREGTRKHNVYWNIGNSSLLGGI